MARAPAGHAPCSCPGCPGPRSLRQGEYFTENNEEKSRKELKNLGKCILCFFLFSAHKFFLYQFTFQTFLKCLPLYEGDDGDLVQPRPGQPPGVSRDHSGGAGRH